MQKIQFFLTEDQKSLLNKHFKLKKLDTNYISWALDELHTAIKNTRRNHEMWVENKLITIKDKEKFTINYDPKFKKPGTKLELKIKGQTVLDGLDNWFAMQNARNFRDEKKIIYNSFQELFFDHLKICLSNVEESVFEMSLKNEIEEAKTKSVT